MAKLKMKRSTPKEKGMGGIVQAFDLVIKFSLLLLGSHYWHEPHVSVKQDPKLVASIPKCTRFPNPTTFRLLDTSLKSGARQPSNDNSLVVTGG